MTILLFIIALIVVANMPWNNKRISKVEHNNNRIMQDYARQLNELDRLSKQQEREERAREAAEAKLVKEQERLAKEQERIEKRVADLEYRVTQAESDIEHWNDQLNSLYAMLDYELAQQAATITGGPEYVKHQNKIITLNNRVHTAEQRLAKAKHIKEQAEKELSA